MKYFLRLNFLNSYTDIDLWINFDRTVMNLEICRLWYGGGSSSIKLPELYPIFKKNSMALTPKCIKHNPVARAPSTVLKSLFLLKSLWRWWHIGQRVVALLPVSVFWTLMIRWSFRWIAICSKINLFSSSKVWL